MKREDIEGTYTTAQALRWAGSTSFEPSEDPVCVEHTYQLLFNHQPVARMVASPRHLRELGAGFVISEGLAREVRTVEVTGSTIAVEGVAAEGEGRQQVTESSGGTSFSPARRAATLVDTGAAPYPMISSGEIFQVIAEIVSELWQKTGGAHCSVLYFQGAIVARSSDVGRHNTVDKVIGHAILNGIDPGQCVLGCTGRQPAGMVRKAANAGIPMIVSKAATTAEGIALAQAAGITLICRVKDASFSVYSHRWRVTGGE